MLSATWITVTLKQWQLSGIYVNADKIAKKIQLQIQGTPVGIIGKKDIEINWPARTEYGETEKQILKDIF